MGKLQAANKAFSFRPQSNLNLTGRIGCQLDKILLSETQKQEALVSSGLLLGARTPNIPSSVHVSKQQHRGRDVSPNVLYIIQESG